MRRCPRCGRTLLESDFYRMGNRSVVEFVIGVACLNPTVMLYIAGMMRDRRIQAEFARRRAAREEREAERRSRR